MEYTVIVNDRSYDLPKKTISVVEKIDNVLKVDSLKGCSIKQKFEKLHSFVKEVVGDDNAKDMFGSDDIAEIDLSEVTLAVKKIISVAKAAEKISSMPQQK